MLREKSCIYKIHRIVCYVTVKLLEYQQKQVALSTGSTAITTDDLILMNYYLVLDNFASVLMFVIFKQNKTQ